MAVAIIDVCRRGAVLGIEIVYDLHAIGKVLE
jgi:hypothetical protein